LTRLTERLGREAGPIREALASLLHESDSDIFFEAVYEIGKNLEKGGRVEIAAILYQSIDEALPDANVGRRSRASLDAILGRGAVLPRAEFLARRFAETSSDPVLLTAMTAAGATFRVMRLGLLSRFATSASSILGWRPLAARAGANTLAFISETATFTGTVRAGNALLGRSQDWSWRGISTEFASGTLSLLGLRGAGALSGRAVRALGKNPSLARNLLQISIPQAGMLTGILFSHRLERSLGLRPELPGETAMTDALVTLMQYNVGARMAPRILGERSDLLERRADLVGETMLRPERLQFRGPMHPSLVSLVTGSLCLAGCQLHGSSWEQLGTLLGSSLPLLGMALWAPPRRVNNALRILTDLQTQPLPNLLRPVSDLSQYVAQGRRLSPDQFKVGFNRLLDVMRASDEIDSEPSVSDELADRAMESIATILDNEHIGSAHVQPLIEALPEQTRRRDYFSLSLRVERRLARKRNLLPHQYEALGQYATRALNEPNDDPEVPVAAQEVLEGLLENPKVPAPILTSILESRRHNADS